MMNDAIKRNDEDIEVDIELGISISKLPIWSLL